MGIWGEVRGRDGRGDVSLPSKQDAANLVASMDAVERGQTKRTSFMRSDGALVEVYHSSDGKVVINRVEGNHAKMDVSTSHEVRDEIVRRMEKGESGGSL